MPAALRGGMEDKQAAIVDSSMEPVAATVSSKTDDPRGKEGDGGQEQDGVGGRGGRD